MYHLGDFATKEYQTNYFNDKISLGMVFKLDWNYPQSSQMKRHYLSVWWLNDNILDTLQSYDFYIQVWWIGWRNSRRNIMKMKQLPMMLWLKHIWKIMHWNYSCMLIKMIVRQILTSKVRSFSIYVFKWIILQFPYVFLFKKKTQKNKIGMW